LSLAKAYASHQRVAISTVGLRAANHGGFFDRLRCGGSITDQRYQRLVEWFSKNWPDDLPWVEIIRGNGNGTVNAQGDAALRAAVALQRDDQEGRE